MYGGLFQTYNSTKLHIFIFLTSKSPPHIVSFEISVQFSSFDRSAVFPKVKVLGPINAS